MLSSDLLVPRVPHRLTLPVGLGLEVIEVHVGRRVSLLRRRLPPQLLLLVGGGWIHGESNELQWLPFNNERLHSFTYLLTYSATTGTNGWYDQSLYDRTSTIIHNPPSFFRNVIQFQQWSRNLSVANVVDTIQWQDD